MRAAIFAAVAAIACQPSIAAQATLTARKLSLTIRVDDEARVASLRSGDVEWIAGRAPLLRIYVRERMSKALRPCSPRELGLRCSMQQPRPDEVVLRWSAGPSGLEFRGRVRATGDALVMELAGDSRGKTMAEAVEFPVLATAASLSSDDGFALPRYDGCWLPATAAAIGAHGREMVSEQPGSWSMQWLARIVRGTGLYIATHDPRGYPKASVLRRRPKALEIAVRHLFPARRRQSLTVRYPVVLRAFSGTWADAAGIYRAWAEHQPWCRRKWDDRDDIPPSLRRAGAMVLAAWRQKGKNPHQVPENVRRLLQQWKKQGAGTLLVHSRGWERHGTWVAQDYFPPYPDERTFRELSAVARSFGSDHFVFLSGYVWTKSFRKRPDGSFEYDSRGYFEQYLVPHAVLLPNGQPFSRKSPWLLGGENAELCRGDPWVRQLIDGVVEKLRGYGVRLVQLDQVVGGGGTACYSRQHGHPPGNGLWMHEALVDQMKSLRAAGLQEGDFGLSLEEPSELYIPYLAFYHGRDHELRGWPIPPGGRPLPLFAYVYHQWARGYAGWLSHGLRGIAARDRPAALRYTAALAVANGKLLGIMTNMVPGEPGDAVLQKLIVAAARLSVGDGRKWLMYGRMLPPPLVRARTLAAAVLDRKGRRYAELRFSAVVGAQYQSDDGSRSIVLVNHTGSPEEAVVSLPEGFRPQQWLRADARGVRRVPASAVGGQLRVRLGPAEVALVVAARPGHSG